MPQVSVIMPCHNVQSLVPRALESVLTQSRLKEMIILPVDDGSTDNTWQVLQDYAAAYPDLIHPIRLPTASGGPGRPRNAALDHSDTPYVIFMDPDDRVHKDGYSQLLTAIETYGSNLVIGTRYAVAEDDLTDTPLWVDFVVDPPWVNESGYTVKLRLLRERPFILKTIYERAHIDRYGLRFLEGISSSEDEIFDMRFALLADRITKINDIVYLYTAEREGSITSRISTKLYQDLPTVIRGLHDALSTYFPQEIVSLRIASLLRAFYLAKLHRLDPGHVDQALHLIRDACAAYGFDRLMLTEHLADREMLAALNEGRLAQVAFSAGQRRPAAAPRRLGAPRRDLSAPARPSPFTQAIRDYLGRQQTRALHRRQGTLEQFRLANSPGPALVAKRNPYWVFMDRRDKASDNAEALYRFVREHGVHNRIKFVLSSASRDFDRLTRDGFDLLPYGSSEHWELLHGCDRFFASHVDEPIINPWASYGPSIADPSYRLEFLQHGVITSDLSYWLGQKRMHRFFVSAKAEYRSILYNVDYGVGPDQLRLTGLARHDLLRRWPGGYILVAPTWRSDLHAASGSTFVRSSYYRAWTRLLREPTIQRALQETGQELVFLLHPDMQRFRGAFLTGGQVRILDFSRVADVSTLVSGASMLVTDFSSIAFDAAYSGIPVVFYRFDDASVHFTERSRNYDIHSAIGTLTRDLVSTVHAMREIGGRGYVMSEAESRATDDFFAFRDQNNRRRIISTLDEGAS